LGCGCGAELPELKSVGTVEAIELDHESAQLARWQGVEVVEADISSIDLGENKYDLVVALDVLEHLKDDELVLRKIERCLKVGGRALVAVPAFPFLFGQHDLALGHWRRYTKSGLIERLSAVGFADISVRYWNSLLFLPIVVWRFLKKVVSPARGRSQDFPCPPFFMNSLLLNIMRFENRLQSAGLRFPAGVSLWASVEKRK
jgi:SAM-dependent methyltransferase